MILSIISFFAIFSSIISLVPQIYKTYKTKSCEDISIWMLINFNICSVCWIIYGFMLNATTVWVTNVIMIIFSTILLYFKFVYKGDKNV